MDKEAKINLLMFIILSTLLLVLMIYSVIAPSIGINNNATSQVSLNISIISTLGNTTSGITFNEDVSYVFNFTINHSSISVNENLTHVNITFPANVTFVADGSSGVGNVTATEHAWNNITRSNTSDTMIFNGTNSSNVIIFDDGNASNPGKNYTFLWFNASIGTPGKYNITVLFRFNNTATANLTNLSIIVNDTTKPYAVNVSGVSGAGLNRSFANVSGTIIINVSVEDNGNFSSSNDVSTEINYVNISFFNGSDYNSSYRATNVTKFSGLGHYWNVSINTANIADGVYNVTIAVNDTLNNVNFTNISNMRVDNTKPTGSASCTPTTVNAGSKVTCTCSPTDVTSGVNSSATSITSSPSTSNTGTFTETCTFADMAGNTASASTTYTVELGTTAGGGGGGGGSSGSQAETFYKKNIDIVSKDFKEIETITQKVGEKERVRVKLDNEVHYVGVRDVTLTSAVIEVASEHPVQFELNVGEEKKVEVSGDNFYDVYVKLNAIVNGKADLLIKYIHEEFTPEVAPVEEEEAVPGEAPAEEETQEVEKTAGLVWVLIILVIIVIIAVVYWIYRKNK